ncbi:MAG: SUMF1/EgtB/PvdO family nonheme iron enzyme [Bacteroidales bacterium]|nr:SUMF1/EgtB/PvdO family nonheme iron enzyme [Bacteroidales bacterium]
MKINRLSILFSLLFVIPLIISCDKEVSQTTGWAYNDPESGGFEYNEGFYEQETGPGLVLIEGGTFSMGRTTQDVVYDWNNVPRRVSVASFYIDESEIRNVDYREYLYWIQRVFIDYPEVHKKALPDTLVWRTRLGYNEPYVEYYFRHPAYQEYPVVGINWMQATNFCDWRTDRVNEGILIKMGILLPDPNQQGMENFNTEAYLAKQYEGAVGEDMEDLDPNKDYRKVRLEDGILLPRYRLPTEAEWEYAAYALIGTSIDERVWERRVFPWDGDHLRNPNRGDQGKMNANFIRGRGDVMGVAGALNDGGDITVAVKTYWPNDFGLYCMAGNVNEWVLDVYRPMNFQDVDEFRPFRGNVFKTQVRDEEGNIAEKDSLGRIQWRDVTIEESIDRRNYQKADNINYLDGDYESSIFFFDEDADKGPGSDRMYFAGRDRNDTKMTSMINDHTRIFKGGSWKDRSYWLCPSTRRYLNENLSQEDLGFRCAMTRVGAPVAY